MSVGEPQVTRNELFTDTCVCVGVCVQAPEERNYHIFYYMLAGMPAEKKAALSLENASDYNYLTMVLHTPVPFINVHVNTYFDPNDDHVTKGKCTKFDGRDDVMEYAQLCSALKILMFSEDDCWEIYRLLAAVLHLGNVKIEGKHFRKLQNHLRVVCLGQPIIFSMYRMISGKQMNNLEACSIVKSSHFSMSSQLLEVCVLY